MIWKLRSPSSAAECGLGHEKEYGHGAAEIQHVAEVDIAFADILIMLVDADGIEHRICTAFADRQQGQGIKAVVQEEAQEQTGDESHDLVVAHGRCKEADG